MTFHGVGIAPTAIEPGEEAVWLSRDAFVCHLDCARRRERVLLTFDDGNLSDFEIALPALRERGLSGIFFVVAARIDEPGYLGRDHIKALIEEGMEIGSHGMEHHPWRGMDESTMKREIVDAREVIEEAAGQKVVKAACPFGSYDRRSLALLRNTGIETVYTSDGGAARAGRWLQARETLHQTDSPSRITELVERRRRPESLLRDAKRLVKRWR